LLACDHAHIYLHIIISVHDGKYENGGMDKRTSSLCPILLYYVQSTLQMSQLYKNYVHCELWFQARPARQAGIEALLELMGQVLMDK